MKNRNPEEPIVLIHPPAISKRYLQTKFLPYGMAVLYSFLRAHGVPAVQYDFLMEYLYNSPEDINYHNKEKSFSEEDYFSFLEGRGVHKGLRDYTEKYCSQLPAGGKIYAFSIVAYHQFWASLLMARQIRAMNPAAVIVFGGPFITLRSAPYLIKYGSADYWIKGSGEEPLLQLFRIHQRGEKIPLAAIPGIITLSGDGYIGNQPAHRPAEEELPPDFAGLNPDMYRYDHPLIGKQSLFLPYRLTKGCVSRCSFCTGRLIDPFSRKSADKIISELQMLSAGNASAAFMFADSAVNNSPELLSRLCKRVAKELPEIAWYAYARIKGFTPGLLREARNAGCFSLFWGVEAAHDPTVRLLGKGFSVRDMFNLIDRSADLGIKNHIHLMYNTPHETEKDIAALISLIERYSTSDYVSFIPHRFLLEPQSLIFTHPAAIRTDQNRKDSAQYF